MTRICSKCEFINQDDYDFCAKCGNPLIEGAQPKNFIVFTPDEPAKINKKAIILSYIVTIVLSWSGFVLNILFKNTNAISFTFFGFFFPIYLIQSSNPRVKRHGLIQLYISMVGIVLSLFAFLNLF